MKRFLQGLAFGALVGVAVAGTLLAEAFGARPALAVTEPLPAEPRGGPLLPAPAPAAREARRLSIRVTPEMTRLSNTRYALYFLGTLWSVGALLLILRSGLSAKLRDLAEQRSQHRLIQAYVYFPLLLAAYGAASLPLTFYSSYLLPHQYGLSTQSLGGWVLDGLKGFALTAAIGPAVVALLYWTLRRSPGRWWVGFWLASIPLLVLSILLGPLVIAPLFNRFEPLRNAQLRDRLLALAARAGITRSRVFEVDASTRTKAVNAYVTGIGGSARIVLWDTLLERLDEDEVSFVMAHEMGHYVERHVPILLGVSIFGTLGVLLLADRTARLLIRKNGERWHLRSEEGLADYATLPVLVLLMTLINFFGSPVESAISRTLERRADAFALRLTRDGEAGASAFVKLGELNLSNPEPPAFIEWWMFSHPPLNERIRTALDPGHPALQSGKPTSPAP